MKCNVMFFASILIAAGSVFADITVSNVEVFSGYPWQEVLIGYTITGSTDRQIDHLELTAKDNVTGKTYECKTLEGVDFTQGSHVIKWNAALDGVRFKSNDVIFTIRIVPKPSPYCIIDLAEGALATHYSVTGLEHAPSTGWTDEYKTTKLVLRLIDAGTFKMRNQYDITLTQPFYMAVFEMTQKQYELVMGSDPTLDWWYDYLNDIGEKRPAHHISYDLICGSLSGAQWPESNAVDEDSFLGKLRRRTGLDFDLPTEAQWEYACRAGTTSDYNNGGSSEDDLKELGRYSGNRDGNYTSEVGLYLPNAWGLYDMHGNVSEWCRDRYKGSWKFDETKDPKGADSGETRVVRGGNCSTYAGGCISSNLENWSPSWDQSFFGFRISRTLDEAEILFEVSSKPVSVDTTFVDGSKMSQSIVFMYGSVGGLQCKVMANGTEIVSSKIAGKKSWTLTGDGEDELRYSSGGMTMKSYVSLGITISDFKVFSGWPWQEVVIGYTVTGSSDKVIDGLEITARDNISGKAYVCRTLEGVDMSPGYHVIKWNASADDAKFKSDDVTFTVKVVRGQALYYVIDLSGGVSATSYRVKELSDMPIDGWTDEYKTTKMVLRRIEAGTFKSSYQHGITLTSPFFIGVFEVTQKQYELVMGVNPSRYNGEMRPVERVSYDMLRGSSAGAGWPIDNAVDADSFLGKLRRRTGLDFDLPTEAQWEHACRAGTTTYYNNGGASEDDLKTLGRYWGNCSDGKGGYTDAHTKVGSYLPNAWGLYDMHGNVREWCLDWENGILGDMTDPKGADTGSYRVECGGSYYGTAYDCRASYHGSWKPSSVGSEVGFRLAKSIRNDETFSDINEETFAPVSFGGMSVDTTFMEGTKVGPSILISYGSVGAAGCTISANGTEIVNSKGSGLKEWALTELGTNSLMYSGGVVMESSVLAMCYWIVFDPNGGSPTPSASLKWKDTPYDSLPTVTRKGCKFLGWFTDVSGGTRVTEDTIVDSERTLYAHWEPIMHTIVFDSRGGSEVASSSMQEEFTYGDLPAPVRDGLLFFGWYTSPEGGERIVSDSTVDSDRTLYARWIGVSNIEVFSGCPWQEVVIGYTITGGGDESIPVELQVSAKDNEHEKIYEGVTLVGVDLTEGQHMIKWNASADGSKFKSEDVIFSIKLSSTPQASGSQGDNNGNTMASVEALSECVGVDTTFGAPVAADGVVHVAYGSVDDLVGCRILADGEELVAATKRGSLAWVAKDGVILEWTSGALAMQSEVKVGLIANVGVFSSWPWKDVLIGYTISGPTATPKDYLEVTATDNATGKKYECKTLEGVDITPGTHVVKWNASVDGAKFKSEDVDFTLRIVSPPSPLYCVVDLSGGADAVSYPVTYLDAEPEGGWAKEYKTQKLVLRRIGAGSFKMQGMMTTTISKPFYMGVFEVTQGQWELVMGSNPCSSTPNCGPAYPVHYVSYNMIRGEGGSWPSSTAVDASSFVGRLQARTGLGFDLPTEAQWEYACRAGTTTTYYWGNTIDGNYAWSRNNWSSQWAHPVGALLPNAWGLYDMSGNVWEWCLDWHGALKYGTDPKGVETGSLRVIRGGNWYSSESWCTSSCREPNLPSSDYHDPSATYGMYHIGFRLSRSIQDER